MHVSYSWLQTFESKSKPKVAKLAIQVAERVADSFTDAGDVSLIQKMQVGREVLQIVYKKSFFPRVEIGSFWVQ